MFSMLQTNTYFFQCDKSQSSQYKVLEVLRYHEIQLQLIISCSMLQKSYHSNLYHFELVFHTDIHGKFTNSQIQPSYLPRSFVQKYSTICIIRMISFQIAITSHRNSSHHIISLHINGRIASMLSIGFVY